MDDSITIRFSKGKIIKLSNFKFIGIEIFLDIYLDKENYKSKSMKSFYLCW